jgi:hypothetical protein
MEDTALPDDFATCLRQHPPVTLADDFDMAAFLALLTARTIELTGVHDVGILIAQPDGVLHAMTVSTASTASRTMVPLTSAVARRTLRSLPEQPSRAPVPGTVLLTEAVPTGAFMSLLQSQPAADSRAHHPDELELAFRHWADSTDHPDAVHVGHRALPMADLARLLSRSHGELPAATCVGLGLRPGATIATAATTLLWATVDPEGPRCRSFRAATFFLRGLALLDADIDVHTDQMTERELP